MKSLPLNNHHYQELQYSFSRWLKVLNYSPQACYMLPLHVREFLNYLEEQGITGLQHLTGKEPENYLTYMARDRCHAKTGQPLSAAHLNKHRQALNLLSRYLSETGSSTVNWQLAQLPPDERIPAVLSKQQIEKLYATCPATPIGLRDRALLSVLYGCGLRRGEAVALRTQDINLAANQLYVRKAKGNKQRYVPLSPGVAEDLQAYLHTARPLLLKGVPVTELLLTWIGKPMGGQGMLARLRVWLQIAIIPSSGIGLHTLRHSIATHLLQAGMKLENISRFLGHQSIESTQIYTHLADEL